MALAEVLESFVGQFYDERTAPKLILTVGGIAGRGAAGGSAGACAPATRWKSPCPQRGEKREIMERRPDQCPRTAGPAHGREQRPDANCWKAWPRSSGWTRRPAASRSMTIPISRARMPLGAFIVAGPDGFEKDQYRKFNIKIDRTHARRRLRHDARSADPPLRPPGQGRSRSRSVDVQMAAARPGADRWRAGPAVASPARSSPIWGWRMWRWSASPRARTAMPAASISTCPARSPSASIPKARFCITCNACATKRIASPSAAIARSAAPPSAPIRWTRSPGVGAGRKRALLQHFGSARAVAGASLADLESVGGVSATLAKKIYDFFHPTG